MGVGRGKDGGPFFFHRPEDRHLIKAAVIFSAYNTIDHVDVDVDVDVDYADQVVDISTLVCPFLCNPRKLIVPNLVNIRIIVVIVSGFASSSPWFIP